MKGTGGPANPGTAQHDKSLGLNILYIKVLRRECPHMPRGVSTGKISPAGPGIIEVMSKSPSRRFPVTVARLPVTCCRICNRTVAYRPGNLSEVLTEHYRRVHPEALGHER
jgi:hypothetical protein